MLLIVDLYLAIISYKLFVYFALDICVLEPFFFMYWLFHCLWSVLWQMNLRKTIKLLKKVFFKLTAALVEYLFQAFLSVKYHEVLESILNFSQSTPCMFSDST